MTTPPAQGYGTPYQTVWHNCFPVPSMAHKCQTIEIPLFQRATTPKAGKNEQARQVRQRFIADLCAALDSDGKSLHLDFVFGDG